MNAVSSNWSCTYSSTTYKFTISRSSGTAQLKFAGGANVAKTVATMLGYIIADKSAGSPYVGDFAVEVERYAFGALTDNLILKWETGANGIDAATPRGAGVLFGFDMARDYDESATFCLPQSPANAREQRCAISGDRYGKRTRRTFDLRAVRDTETAREMRNRLLSWWEAPPVEIQFQTERAFDFDLGHIFEFDATLDEVQPFTVRGTDGSWVGKQFIVTGLVRHSVPTSHQELVAFLVPAS
jgi:hypothetical protein